jgi:hypothetical protein
MDRNAALAAVLLIGGAALAKPAGKSVAKKPAASHSLHVRSIDLQRRYVLVELTGAGKPPAPNLFTFTDERDRHYVAMGASCEPPAVASGVRSCALEMPAGYERHKLVRLELHLGNLHSRTIAASESEVAAAWEAALLARVQPSPSPSPQPLPSPKPKAKPQPSPRPRPSPAP